MNQRFVDIVIWITALTYAGFAVWLGSRPDALLEAFGIEDRTPAMATEIRAFYGGVELAIAVAMGLLWMRGDLFAALLIGGLPLAGAVLGRVLGMLLDGFSSLHLTMAAFELIGCVLCFVGCWWVDKKRNASE